MTMNLRPGFLFLLLLLASFSFAQDTTQVFKWNVNSKKISANTYELVFSTKGNASWSLYAPDQDLSGVMSASLILADSSFQQCGL